MESIYDNVRRVQERIAAACQRSGRRPEDVKLVAISKTFPAERVREAYHAGLREFGENRVQEAAAKRAALADLGITWHLVGHLQTNKAKTARELFQWVHSVDTIRLAQKLHQAASAGSARLRVLIEVNLAGEESKSGTRPQDVLPLAEEISRLGLLELRGLMAIPPIVENPEDARPYFRRLREMAEQLAGQKIAGITMADLSMGMTHDFEVAIEEGATIVRVGTGIFGGRD
ncbi:MAG TPA: YggS family pyridoxal phosphate-dependent enzyme [Terriglobia bacterium]|nr:YggS family pyridoxal phosphate-dependent enzyme [Terriglobia bacterium]